MNLLTPQQIDGLHKLPPADRCKAAAGLMDAGRQAMMTLAAIRAEAVRDMRDQGMSLAAIGDALGVSRQQVHRIEQGAPAVAASLRD